MRRDTSDYTSVPTETSPLVSLDGRIKDHSPLGARKNSCCTAPSPVGQLRLKQVSQASHLAAANYRLCLSTSFAPSCAAPSGKARTTPTSASNIHLYSTWPPSISMLRNCMNRHLDLVGERKARGIDLSHGSFEVVDELSLQGELRLPLLPALVSLS